MCVSISMELRFNGDAAVAKNNFEIIGWSKIQQTDQAI